MKQRLLSSFMALVLCLSLLPTAAFAQGEDEGHAPSADIAVCTCETVCTDTAMNTACPICGAENAQVTDCGLYAADPEPETLPPEPDAAVAAVQRLVSALPAADALDGMSMDELNVLYEDVQAAWDVFDALTEEQQATLAAEEAKLSELFAAINGYVQPADSGSSVSYIEFSWNEKTKTLTSETKTASGCTAVTSETTTWNTGWYVVSGEVTIDSRVTVTGDVKLILADGANLTVNGGIAVNKGNTFTVYAQSQPIYKKDGTLDETNTRTGKLTAQNAPAYHAAIGGEGSADENVKGDAGKIAIHGGVITTNSGSDFGFGIKSSDYAAGIGGGRYGAGGEISIYGGTVDATGGELAAGIGGGEMGAGGEISIYGGTIIANCCNWGVGIGGGACSDCGEIVIYAGVVNATGGRIGTGIGSGQYAENGGTITIYGGTITATGGEYATGIGCSNHGAGSEITIFGGMVTAYGGRDSAGIGNTYDGTGGGISINGGQVKAISGEFYETDPIPRGYAFSLVPALKDGVLCKTFVGNSLTSLTQVSKPTDTTYTRSKAVHIDADHNFLFNPDGNTTNICKICKKCNATVAHTFIPNPDDETTHLCKICTAEANHSTLTFAADNVNHTISGTCADCQKALGVFALTAPTGSLTYDGNAKAAAVTGTIAGIATPEISYALLGENEEETVLSSAPVSAGTYKASIACGTGDDAVSVSVTYTIAKAAPTAADFTFTEPTNLTYDSEAKIATVTSSITGMGSVTVKYFKDGTEVTKASNAGSYTVKIDVAESDNYNAISNLTADDWVFTISKATPTAADFTAPKNLTYDGSAKTATIKAKSGVTGMGVITVKYFKDGNLLSSAPTDAGTYTVKIGVSEGDNYVATTDDLPAEGWTFTIAKANYGSPTANGSAKFGAAGTVDLSNLIMSGGTAEVTNTTDANSVLSGAPGMSGTKLQFAFANDSAKIGQTAEITVSVTGCTNYNDYTITVTVKVTDKDVPTVSANNITAVYTGSEIPASAITGTATFGDQTVAGSWSFTNAAPKNVADSSNSVSVTFTPEDTANFAAVTATIKVTISKATPTGEPKHTVITTSGKTLADAALTTEGSTFSVAGSVKWIDAEGNDLATDTEVTANTAYKWLFTPTNTDNYNTISGSIRLWSRSSGGSYTPSYTITVEKSAHGTISVSPKSAGSGDTVTITVTPDSGYDLEDLTVLDSSGKELSLTAKGGGKYTFKMPSGKVTVKAVFAAERMENPFVDVPSGAYYEDAVLWALKHGITGGIDKNHFGPDLGCTRAQLVAFLWRAAGSPVVSYTMDFTDVGDSYYTEAVRWAASLGIVGGYGNGLFGTDDTITREQMATILYRFAQSVGMDTANGGMTVREFADYESISGYAAEAMQWAVSAGILQGYNNHLMPSQPCTRAQIVTMLYRLLGE